MINWMTFRDQELVDHPSMLFLKQEIQSRFFPTGQLLSFGVFVEAE